MESTVPSTRDRTAVKILSSAELEDLHQPRMHNAAVKNITHRKKQFWICLFVFSCETVTRALAGLELTLYPRLAFCSQTYLPLSLVLDLKACMTMSATKHV